MNAVFRGILEDDRPLWDFHVRFQYVQRDALPGNEHVPVQQRALDVVEPTYRVEVEILVVVERRLFPHQTEEGVGVLNGFMVVGVVQQIG